MAEIKFTKSALRSERGRLTQLKRYLPTLQLKKAMLQTEVNEVRGEIRLYKEAFSEKRLGISPASALVNDRFGLDIAKAANVVKIEKRYENIAGVDIPLFEGVQFAPFEYELFSTPAWVDPFVVKLREMATAKAQVIVAEEKKEVLEKELRDVTVKVNLFEKNLIPTAEENIRRIRVFLGDQELSAIAQAKVAKAKIEKRRGMQ